MPKIVSFLFSAKQLKCKAWAIHEAIQATTIIRVRQHMRKIHKTNQGVIYFLTLFNYALVSNNNFNHRQVELIQKQVLSYILAIKRVITGKFRVNTKFVLQIKKTRQVGTMH